MDDDSFLWERDGVGAPYSLWTLAEIYSTAASLISLMMMIEWSMILYQHCHSSSFTASLRFVLLVKSPTLAQQSVRSLQSYGSNNVNERTGHQSRRICSSFRSQYIEAAKQTPPPATLQPPFQRSHYGWTLWRRWVVAITITTTKMHPLLLGLDRRSHLHHMAIVSFDLLHVKL